MKNKRKAQEAVIKIYLTFLKQHPETEIIIPTHCLSLYMP
jgi:hypothetical protein